MSDPTPTGARPLPPVPLDVATEPPPPWAPPDTRIAPVMTSPDGVTWGSTTPPTFVYYPPTPLPAEEAAELRDRLRAGIEGAALHALASAKADRLPRSPLGPSPVVARGVKSICDYLDGELGPDPHPGDRDTFARVYLLDLMAVVLEEAREAKPRKRGRPTRLPDAIPQQTYEELRALGWAAADASTLDHWREAPGPLLVHGRPGAQHSVRYVLTAGTAPDGTPAKIVADSMREALLAAGGVDTSLLAQASMWLALDEDTELVAIDDLIRLLGRQPRGTAAREEARRDIWQRLRTLASMEVHGTRRGKYRDPDTGQTVDTYISEPLFYLGAKAWPEQGTLDGSEIPLEVAFEPAAMLRRFRGDRRFLQQFGSYLAVARIPGNKPSGAWARAVGLALNQRWRELATKADTKVTTPGDDNTLTVRFAPFTRRGLLDYYNAAPAYADVLASNDPKRAREYWDKAVALLKREGVIGYYKPAGVALPRYEWADVWLDEPLDIRPPASELTAIAEVAQGAKAAAKKRRGKGKG